MPIPDGAEYQHSSGRKCRWNSTQDRWVYHDHDDNMFQPCLMGGHPSEFNPLDPMRLARGGIPRYVTAIKPGEVAEAVEGWLATPNMMIAMPDAAEFGLRINFPQVPATPEAEYIVEHLVREWLDSFLAKNRKYKDVDQSLGARGVFPDVNRKVGILKSRVWNDERHAPAEESTDEVIMDLIGHLFLMLAMRNMNKEDGNVGD
jgi:hypothetical protein